MWNRGREGEMGQGEAAMVKNVSRVQVSARLPDMEPRSTHCIDPAVQLVCLFTMAEVVLEPQANQLLSLETKST